MTTLDTQDTGLPSTAAPGTPVVAVAASLDGVSAVARFIEQLDAGLEAAVVVMVHGLLHARADLIARLGGVREAIAAVDGARIEPGTIYVAPASTGCTLRAGRLRLVDASSDTTASSPVDALFRSLARERAARAVAVVLSGTGCDGALGVRAVQAAGGMTLAQAPEEADPSEMATHAIDSGGVDASLGVDAIAARVGAWLSHPVARATDPVQGAGPRASEAESFAAIVAYTGATLRRDLRVYKPSTVRRRILRRMALLGIQTPEAYLAYLGHHDDEPALLAEQLLVEVSAFFRDPSAFEALDAELEGCLDAPRVGEFRAWVAGCASGEEAYSIAMLLAERLPDPTHFRVFATDVRPAALARARAGVYPASVADDIGPARLARFFTREGQHVAVRASLRARVTFARHDLVGDPPFSRMNLVSCRNLLIYLKPAAQQRIMQLMHFALIERGLLFLGMAENPNSRIPELFEAVDRTHRLFRRAVEHDASIASTPTYAPTPMGSGLTLGDHRWRGQGHRAAIEQLILDVSVDAAVLVDANLSVVYTHGRIDAYLRYPQGLPTSGISGALPSQGAARIRAAVQAVLAGRTPSTTFDMMGHRGQPIHVQVLGAMLDDRPRALVCFRRSDAPAPTAMTAGDADLAAELNRIERVMNALVEELQASNEDLRASHEEVLSMNEELTTVNGQLQVKLRELEEVNADLTHFAGASRLATIFLDRALRIRRFTPESRQVFRLAAVDVGRPLSDIRHGLVGLDVDAVLEQVVEREALVELEAATAEGRWFLVRVLPHRIRADSGLTGVMLTLVDITQQKRGENEARAHQRRLHFALQGSTITAFMQDAQLEYVEMVHSSRPVVGAALIGARDDALDLGPDGPAFIAFKRGVLATGVAGRRRFRIDLLASGDTRLYDVRARRCGERNTQLMVVAIDITDSADEQAREHEDAEARISHELSKNYLESLGLLAGGVAHDFNNHLMIIQGSLDVMRETGEVEVDLLADVDEAMEASRVLIAQILAFAESEPAAMEPLALAEAVEHTVSLLEPIVPPGIEVSIERLTTRDGVRGAFGRVQQVITNLMHNAIHAMPDGGSLTVRVREATPWVLLEVEDTGVGIAPSALGRIFEPFYTTRRGTRGSGMGLAVVHGIVRSLGGEIDVASQVGRGSTFTVRLPVVDLEGGRPRVRAASVAPARGDGEQVAVIDDDPAVARALASALGVRGFEVSVFGAGADLLGAMEAGARFDALVCDVLMPGLDGPATIAAARALHPGQPAVLISGYTDLSSAQQERPLDGVRWLSKPVVADALVRAIHWAIDPASELG